MAKFIEHPYRIPPHRIDFPFTYIYDARALVDGSSYQRLQLPLQNDADFILRSICGPDTCLATAAHGGRFNYQLPQSQQYAFGAGAGVTNFLGVLPSRNNVVLPEKFWRAGSAIYLDLVNVLRSNVVCLEGTIYKSFIGFRGVKRFDANSGYRTGATPYKYKEKHYSYSFALNLNYASIVGGQATPAQKFWVQLDNMDFELLSIRVSNTTSGSTGPLTTNDFAIQLYDSNLHMTSSIPQPILFLSQTPPTPQTQPIYQPAITPTLVYPGGGAITFDITSLLCAAVVPRTYNILFDGIWRIPC
jgi:hypothetical protein